MSAAELRTINQVDLRLMPKVSDLSALPTAGKNLIIVADLNKALHVRLFDVHGKRVLDSAAKRFTNTWADYLEQLVPRLWPPHELTEVERISVINAARNLAGQNWHFEMQQVHGRIASLVGELRRVYPEDPRVAHYLPERWASLNMSGQHDVTGREAREVLEVTKDPELRTSALYFDSNLRLLGPIDGRTAVSLAESFAAQAPGDKRAGELLHMAGRKLSAEYSMAVGLAAVLAVFAGLLAGTIGMRRWLKYVVRMGLVVLAVATLAVAVLFFLENDTLIEMIRNVSKKISEGSAAAIEVWRLFGYGVLELRGLAGTVRGAFAVALAALCGVLVVAARRRLVEPPKRWLSAIRLGVIVFFVVLAAFCAVDACLMGLERNAIRERIVGDYPDMFGGPADPRRLRIERGLR